MGRASVEGAARETTQGDVQSKKDETLERFKKGRLCRTVEGPRGSRTCHDGVEGEDVDEGRGSQVRSGKMWEHGDRSQSHMDGIGEVDGSLGKEVRRVDRDHAGGGHHGVDAGSQVLGGVHAGRSPSASVYGVLVEVYVFHEGVGHRGQQGSNVRGVGRRGVVFVPAHRFLEPQHQL